MKKYSNSTLMRMTKGELIAQLRCAEYNRTVAEETLAQQAKNGRTLTKVSQGDKGDKGECFCKDFFQIGVF